MEEKRYIVITTLFLSNLDELMFINKVKKYELSSKIGISQSLLTSYYKGSVKKISSEVAQNIADYFKINIDELFKEKAITSNTVSEPIISYGTNEFKCKVDLETYL